VEVKTMFQKFLITVLLCAVAIVFGACSRGPSAASVKPEGNPPSSPKGEAKSSAAPQSTSGAPVELVHSEITADKANVSYSLKINTDKTIDEVHLILKATDARGKVETNAIVWQNIVGSTRKPIENGKTYEDQTALDTGAAKADVSLKEVIFKDGSSWTAK